jgi:hypothetical protein
MKKGLPPAKASIDWRWSWKRILADRAVQLEEGTQHRFDFVAAETGEPKLDSQSAPSEHVQRVAKPTNLVVAVGAEQQDRLARDAAGRRLAARGSYLLASGDPR